MQYILLICMIGSYLERTEASWNMGSGNQPGMSLVQRFAVNNLATG